MYVERSTIAIGVSVDSKYVNANNSFIASVSYNGVKLSTTGDTVSRWKYTTDYGEISRWWTNSYYTDDSLWTSVNSIGLCNANTVPSINRDGFSFSELISANGVTPTKNSPQFGGETARWIGVNENNGDCSIKGAVVYRMTLDLTALADEPVCYSKDDGRSLLSSNTPILSFPNIGVKSPTSQVLTFIGSVQGFLGVWVDGLGSQGRESKIAL